MNVLHINTKDNGGAANACMRLHKGLLKNAISSKALVLMQNNANSIEESYPIYTSKQKALLKGAQNKVFGNREYKIRRLPKEYEGFTFPHSSHAPELHSLVKWADVINLHWVANFLDYKRFFKKVKKPVVWTLHDMNPFSGGYHYIEKFPIDSYRRFIKKNEATKINATSRANLTIVCPSKWLLKESQESKVFNRFEHLNIPYGLNTNVFKPINKQFAREVFSLPADKKVLLFIAGSAVNKRKGYDYLLKALDKLDKQKHILAVVGNKSESLNTHDNVITFGKINDERLMAMAYSAADLFIIPSIEDNLPNTVMESICCGTPVVGFKIGGIPDMIKEGENGLLCEEISSDALAESIQSAMKMEFDKNWIRDDALLRFDESVQAKRYTELYKKLLGL